MTAPSPRQLDVLRLYARAARAGRPSPTVREMATELEVTTTAVVDLLRALEKKALLLQDDGPVRARARKLTPAGWVALGTERAVLQIIQCETCGRLSVAINGSRVTTHKCAGTWRELRTEVVDCELMLAALMAPPAPRSKA